MQFVRFSLSFFIVADIFSCGRLLANCDEIMGGQVEIFSVRSLARNEIPNFPSNISKLFVPNFEKSSVSDIKQGIQNLKTKYPEKEIVPYLPVRKYTHSEAKVILEFFREIDTKEIVVLAGGKFEDAEIRGAYIDTMDFLGKVNLREYGIKAVGVAAHPEFHSLMDARMRLEALRLKYQIAQKQGLSLYILTQLIGSPEKFVQWQNEIRQMGIDSKIYYGVAMPKMSHEDYVKFSLDLCNSMTRDPNHPDFNAETLMRILTPGANQLSQVEQDLLKLGASADGFHFYMYGNQVQEGLDALGAWQCVVRRKRSETSDAI